MAIYSLGGTDYEPPDYLTDEGQGGRVGYTDPPARASQPSYNVTDWWKDPINPPQPQDPYYAGFQQSNPSFTAAPVGPQLDMNGGSSPMSDAWTEAFIRQQLSETGQDPNTFGYWLGKEQELKARGRELGDPGYALRRLRDVNSGGPAPMAGGGGGYNAGGIFDDPATKPFLDLLNQRINALNTPYHNPQLDQLNGYLQQYFQRLQGPAYTPQQMDLMQTAALDPLTRQRDAAMQRVRERASARGVAPTSGILASELNDVDKRFEGIAQNTRSGFAQKAIDLDRINAQQAAGVAQALANIEQTQFGQNEARANQALDLAGQVPQLARQRLMDANAILGQTSFNPASVVGLAQQTANQDAAQQQQLWLSIASLLPSILKLFPGVSGGR